MARKRIGVVPSVELEAHRRLFHALSLLFPVEFCKSERDSYAGLDALVLFGGSREAGIRAAAAGIRCYAVLTTEAKAVHCEATNVNFGGAASLHAYFRDQNLVDGEVREFVPLSPLSGDEIVASREGHVLWIYRPEAGSGVDFLASAPGAHVDIDVACNYAKDEGRPLGAGLQEQASNHLKLLW